MDLIARLAEIVGPAQVLGGSDLDRFSRDATGKYSFRPMAVVRPASTAELSAVMALAHDTGTSVVPVSGNTGLSGGTHAEGALMISLERMNRIREIRPEARIAIVEAGVVLSTLHDAAEAHDLIFPLTFGARGSAMIGGALSTNAGGSNVVRYGNTRALCLGIEAVLADGTVMDLMTELHKDNSGYDLRDLLIGAEGTLGIITAAVVKLFPKPAAYATAMVAMQDLTPALPLLNRLQTETGGGVEAFEYMPDNYMAIHAAHLPDARPAFDRIHPVNIMIEIGATAPQDAIPGPDGTIPVVERLQEVLAEMMETGEITDAVIARNDQQRRDFWTRREQVAEVTLHLKPIILNDISLPIQNVAAFEARMEKALPGIDPGARSVTVAHLGDGNVHYTALPQSTDPAVHDAIMEKVEEIALDLGGSFSAEHGIGISKKPSMARRKNPVAIQVMRQIKAALDPKGILNPGKVLPDP